MTGAGSPRVSSSSRLAFVGLGSNLGDRRAQIEAALAWLDNHPRIEVSRATRVVETAPWGLEDQPRFLNAVAELRTSLSPSELLAELLRAEEELGRKRGGRPRWGPREIDMDILFFEDLVLNTERLTIPHPRLTERPFVIAQVLDLAPDLIHPAHHVPLSEFAKST
ncbi:MAG: 2-amino-4-hydroxy-6-hydroxymethyldihydropteridine diphosphokinase [Polyangia bacterium]